jgi:hypothetical protein
MCGKQQCLKNIAGQLVVRERTITDEDLKRGISTEELVNRVHKRIDAFPDK